MTQPIHGQRSAAIAGPPTRQAYVRAASLNEEMRTFQAVVASEQAVLMIDYRRGDVVEEILVATGGEFPTSVPLLDSHSRASTVDVIGSMRGFYRDGRQWIANGQIAAGDSHSDTVWSKIRDGHLNSFSIGYRIHEYQYLEPQQSATVQGRLFTNTSDTLTLRLVTKWAVDEVSIVAVPADSNAKIRSESSEIRSFDTVLRSAPAIHSRDSVSSRPSQGMLESALMMRMGFSDPSRHRVRLTRANQLVRLAPCDIFEQECDRAQTWHNAHLAELVREAAALDRVDLPAECGRVGVLQACWQHYSKRGMSNFNTAMGSLFANVFGALFLQGFDEEIDTTEGWTSEADNLTLKVTPRVRMETLSPFSPRDRGRAAEHVTIGTPSESTKVNEFSAKLVIDEQDVLNNQFGNTEQIMPEVLGSAAKRLRPDLVYSVLLANPVMRDGVQLFHNSHVNLQGSSALADATLGAAQSLISSHTEAGVSLNLRGRYLLVPPALERTAAKLLAEVELINSSSSLPMVLRSEGRLGNGVVDPLTGTVHAGSNTSWYLAADGKQHTIEVSYLEGTGRQPVIRMGFLSEGQFGMWFDVEHFVGATALDWRGMAKSTV